MCCPKLTDWALRNQYKQRQNLRELHYPDHEHAMRLLLLDEIASIMVHVLVLKIVIGILECEGFS